MSATVCACLRLIYQRVYHKSRYATVFYPSFFGHDPQILPSPEFIFLEQFKYGGGYVKDRPARINVTAGRIGFPALVVKKQLYYPTITRSIG
jgi:hypothetical protein